MVFDFSECLVLPCQAWSEGLSIAASWLLCHLHPLGLSGYLIAVSGNYLECMCGPSDYSGIVATAII